MGELRSLHVLVLGTVLGQGRGGVRRHNEELLPRAAKQLAAAGGSLTILEGREPCAFDLPPEIERIPTGVPARPVLRRALAEGHALRRALDQRAAEGRPIDLVHTAHQPVPRGFTTPLSVLIHDLRALDLHHSPFSRRLFAREILGRSLKRAGVVMTVSEAMADLIAHSLQVDRTDIRVVPNAGDHFEPLPRRVDPEAPMLCIGHLEPRKNQRLLIEALALDPSLPRLRLIGTAKQDEELHLRARAAELGVEARVEFTGDIEDAELREQLARARCVVLPSLLEGFGISVLEARIAGVPLAVSAIPAHLEVAGGAASFAQDAADCARAIHRALASTQEELEAAAASAKRRYSWDSSAELLVRAWSSVGTEA